MENLDDVKALTAIDPKDVLGSIGMFPDQCEAGWKEAKQVEFPDAYRKAKNIVVAGMGGSRFTPRTVKELFADILKVPYEITDDYSLPGYVNQDTLVIMSSYSGSTEEVLSCGRDALARKAKLTAIAAGGKVIELARGAGIPFYQFDPVHNPSGQPRVGGGYLLMAHMAFLSELGYLTVEDKDVSDAIAYCRTVGKSMKANVPEKENPAKQLAHILKDKHVFLVAAEFMRGAVNGFANQINETAKMISDYRYIPELNHHLMEGLKRPGTLHENGLFVFLESGLYRDAIQKRYTITKEVVEKQQVATHSIRLSGPDRLSQVLESYALAGFSTFYLAMLYDTDPVLIPWVDYFKEQLKK